MGKRRKWIKPKQDRWCRHFEFWIDQDTHTLLCSGDTNVCPHCGGKAYIPPAMLSSDDDISIRNRYKNTCHLVEVCDESGGCIGYTIYCKTGRHGNEWLSSCRKTGNIFYAKPISSISMVGYLIHEHGKDD